MINRETHMPIYTKAELIDMMLNTDYSEPTRRAAAECLYVLGRTDGTGKVCAALVDIGLIVEDAPYKGLPL
jgi:hypothetical protein